MVEGDFEWDSTKAESNLAKHGVSFPEAAAVFAVREAVGQTQIDVAQTARMDLSDVSRLENRDDFGDCQVSTLQRYVAALKSSARLIRNVGIITTPRKTKWNTSLESPLQL